MSVHIGDINSEVTVAGTPGSAPVTSSEGDAKKQPWDLLEQHRALVEKDHDERRRTAGEGFDG